MYSIPPERLGEATRRQLYRTLHEAQEQVRRAGHALHDEYQNDQSRALYDLANRLGDIKAQYSARTNVLQLERPALKEPAAAAARVRPGGLSHPFMPDQSDPRMCGDLHPDDGLPCGWDHEGLDP